MGVTQRVTDWSDVEAMVEATARCWCGGDATVSLGDEYVRCADCGTLVYRQGVEASEHTSGDGDAFYGDRYWCHQVPQIHGLPRLEERARLDLPERATFHLLRVLEHLAPSGRVLELGCGAGSLTYLLGEAGFDAEGLELGPAAIDLARRHFGLRIHSGPLEGQDDPGPWNAIVAVDVLEHLPDPLGTMQLCARRLASGGRLFLQTPCYRGEGDGWAMLLPEEHLHLFTETSVERLLHSAGFSTVEVRRSLFAHDMWVIAALEGPLEPRSEPLEDLPPLVVALVDAHVENARLGEERDAIEADRDHKQADVDRLLQQHEAMRFDQTAKAELLRRQDADLRQVQEDQERKHQLIERLDAELTVVRADQAAKHELIEQIGPELEASRLHQAEQELLNERLVSELESVRDDRKAKQEILERLGTELQSVRADQTAKQSLIERMNKELQEVQADQQAKETVIMQLEQARTSAIAERVAVQAELATLQAELGAIQAERAALQAELDALQVELDAIQGDWRYRWFQAMGVPLGGRR